MPSKRKIARYAEDWLRWYPDRGESDLREALERRFLTPATDAELIQGAAAGTAEGASSPGHNPADYLAGGCLGLFLFGPLAVWWNRRFPVDRAQVASDVEAVLEDLRARGRWADG